MPERAGQGEVGEGEKDRDPQDRQGVGDPVDVASGEMFLGERDVLVAAAFPVELSRRHISSWRAGRWFGPTWSSTLDARLEVEPDRVVLATGEATVHVFPAERDLVDGVPVETGTGRAWELTRLTPQDAAWGQAPDAVRRYVVAYRAVDVLAARTWWFAPVPGTPDPGLLPVVAVTDPAGRWIGVGYDAGRLARVEHHGGVRVLVDVRGGLVRAYRLDDGTPGGRVLRRFGYDDRRRLVAVTDTDGTHAFDYDTAGRVVAWTDRTGFVYRYTYDDAGRVVRTHGTGGALDGTISYTPVRDDPAADDPAADDPATGSSQRPDPRTVTVTAVTDPSGATTRYEIDGRRLVVAVTDPLGGRTTYQHDARHRVVAVADPLGRTTRVERDAVGRVLAVHAPDGTITRHERDGRGRLVRQVAPDGAVTAVTWDDADRPTSLTNALGAVTTWTYTPTTIVETLPDGAVITHELDAAGRPRATVDPLGAVTRYQHDALGHLVSVTDPLGHVTRTERDAEGRPHARVLPDGSSEAWEYDPEGRLVAHTDAAGGVTRCEIGAFGVVAGIVTADGATTRVRYDNELRPIAVTDPRGLTWTYRYDPAGRLVEQVDYDGVPTRYDRDLAGQVTARITADTTTTAYEYDPVGRLLAARGPDTWTTYRYDPAGRLVAAANPDHTLTLTRDVLGRVVTETVDDAAITSEYGPSGHRRHRRLPDGTETTWTYDAAGRPLTLSSPDQQVTFAHDAAGQLTQRTHTSRDAGATLTVEHTWDDAGRLLAQVTALTGATGAGLTEPAPVHARRYTWRPDGYVTRISETLPGATLPSVDVRDYTLDVIGRITAVTTDTQPLERYRYNAAGDLIDASWPAQVSSSPTAPDDAPPAQLDNALTSDAARGPRLYQHSRVERAGRVAYTYDTRGRVVARTLPTLSGQRRATTYTWTSDDRLAAVTTPDGGTWTYTYDPLGRRTTKTAPDATPTRFTWDGPVLVAEHHDTLARVWHHHPGTYRPITQTTRTRAVDGRPSPVVTRAVLTDTAGTPTHLADPSTGTLTWTRDATVWGIRRAPRQTDPPTAESVVDLLDYCPLDHPGQYHDPETATNDNHHRHYDPHTAAYLTADPLGLTPAPNHRTYPHNPHTWTDPHGLQRNNTGACPKGAAQPPPPVQVVQDETTAPRPVGPSNAIGQWEQFLGEGTTTNIHPRTQQQDPDRIVSADGKRSIRLGGHEMGSSPTKFHYHEETWDFEAPTNTWRVVNRIIRVPFPKGTW